MVKKSVPRFSILREPVDVQTLRYCGFINAFTYRVEFEDDRPSGYARLHLEDAGLRLDLPNHEPLVKAGVHAGDVLATIALFYPNGDETVFSPRNSVGGYNEAALSRFARQGVGTRVLQQLVEDSLEHDARVLYTFTWQRAMKNFLRKHQFTAYNTSMPAFYKLL
ncbi:hypothetical protein GF342_05920 [Candidatus Woesearchaeota archaeon]|nr:hypothetical protein [Candidatus Woesearchaeota archaeon]